VEWRRKSTRYLRVVVYQVYRSPVPDGQTQTLTGLELGTFGNTRNQFTARYGPEYSGSESEKLCWHEVSRGDMNDYSMEGWAVVTISLYGFGHRLGYRILLVLNLIPLNVQVDQLTWASDYIHYT
jgi:hypothetical protein